MNDITAVEAFLQEAKRRLTEMEQAQVRKEAMEIARNRMAWTKVMDKVKNQLLDVLKDFVVVTDPDQMDNYPTFEICQRYLELRIPFCTPISFHFVPASWKIDTYWPRIAMGVEQEDISGEFYIRSIATRGYSDIYIAAAYAHEGFPAWKRCEDELGWRLEGKASMENTDDVKEIELDWSRCYPKPRATKLTELLT